MAFEDFFVFTMDVVFLQNRKLIYSWDIFVYGSPQMDRVKYSTIADVYKKYPTNTLSKFKKIASRYGFTDDEAHDYLSTIVIHDQRVRLPK